jgi:hypothetical protein
MNLQHAAPFALVGWYLLAAPIDRKPGGALYATDSISMSPWRQLGAYDSADKCVVAKGDQFDRASVIARANTGSISSAVIAQATDAICMASDDPRLARPLP